jgi:hypothetical protein
VGNHSPRHCGNYASNVPSQEKEGQKKILNMSRGDRKIDGDVQEDCSRLWQITESNIVFLRG